MTVEQVIASTLYNMNLDSQVKKAAPKQIRDTAGILPSKGLQSYIAYASSMKMLPARIPGFTSPASVRFTVSFFLAALRYRPWEKPAAGDEQEAAEAILTSLASESGIIHTTDSKLLNRSMTNGDLKKLFQRFKNKLIGVDICKAAWTYYGKGKLGCAKYIFQQCADAGINEGTTRSYYANTSYGLGLCDAHFSLKHYASAAYYFSLAAKYDPDGKVGKSAADYLKNKLPPIQLDLDYQPDRECSYEEIMALVGHHLNLDTKAVPSNFTVTDSSGKEASEWARSYVELAQYRKCMPKTPSSFGAPAPKAWIAQYVAAVKGLYQYDYETFRDFTDTRDLSTDERMYISIAVERNLLQPKAPGIFEPAAGISRNTLKPLLQSARNLIVPEKPAVTKESYPKMVQTYFVGGRFDQVDVLQKRAASLDMVNFDAVNFGSGSPEEGTRYVSTQYGDPVISTSIAAAKSAGTRCFLALHNFRNGDFDKAYTHELIGDVQKRADLAGDLVKLADLYEMAGVHIDFEHLYPTDRENFNAFLQELSSKLKEKNKLLTVAVGAYFKGSDEEASEYDYSFIGKVADYINIILYDDFPARKYASTGKLGPLSNIIRIERVLKYATIEIPSRKILLGMGAYGIDYNITNRTAASVKLSDVVTTAYSGLEGSVKFAYDPKTASATLEYTDKDQNKHVIYYESKASIQRRVEAVHRFRLGGISFYWVGSDSDDMYSVFAGDLKQ